MYLFHYTLTPTIAIYSVGAIRYHNCKSYSSQTYHTFQSIPTGTIQFSNIVAISLIC